MTNSIFPLNIYGAGPLFWEGEILWNALLAPAIAKASHGRFKLILPQDNEFPDVRSATVKNEDIRQLIVADGITCNYSLVEIDSGTVIEQMVASELFHPAVLYRGDMRKGGDQLADPREGARPDWNLMASSWARTVTVWWNAAVRTQQAKGMAQPDKVAAAEPSALGIVDLAAIEIVRGLERSFSIPFNLTVNELQHAFDSLIRRAEGLAAYCSEHDGISIPAIRTRFVERKLLVQEAVRDAALFEPSEFGADVKCLTAATSG